MFLSSADNNFKTTSQISKLTEQVEMNNLQKQKVVLLIDYRKPISQKRFFVFDYKNKKILYEDFVGHASSSGNKIPIQNSNTPGSLKTSLGLYSVGKKYYGSYGESFKLHGLEKQNSNAYRRGIIIHTIRRPKILHFDENLSASWEISQENKEKYLYSNGCFVFYEESYSKIITFMKKGRKLIVFN